ncbi:hypothetical protein H5410_020196 [Solanum commersonii]|uniref:Uncharacterized protein n=1 Tax=Solanum commersonii TaxID=4109 RepID=A0A9J5Z7B8_SOLCO|nr:hypothetical protein H5410_020196 [Solanum commersonii]
MHTLKLQELHSMFKAKDVDVVLSIPVSITVMTVEAIAIRKALKYAIRKGRKLVKILSNAKNVVDMNQKRVTTS